MISTKRILTLAAVVMLVAPACNNLNDDPESPNVVLEAENLVIPPITAAVDQATGNCTITNCTFANNSAAKTGAPPEAGACRTSRARPGPSSTG
jgi:hypothetical protein